MGKFNDPPPPRTWLGLVVIFLCAASVVLISVSHLPLAALNYSTARPLLHVNIRWEYVGAAGLTYAALIVAILSIRGTLKVAMMAVVAIGVTFGATFVAAAVMQEQLLQ